MQVKSNVPMIGSYERAKAYYDNASIGWQSAYYKIGNKTDGYETKITPTGARKMGVEKKYRSVWMSSDEAIRFRYHNTDIVSYLPNDDVEIVPWASLSTTTLVNGLTHETIQAEYASPAGCLLKLNDRVYSLDAGHLYTLRRGETGLWSIEGDIDVVRWPKMDPLAARKIYREHNLYVFKCWLDATYELAPGFLRGEDMTEAQLACAQQLGEGTWAVPEMVRCLGSAELWVASLASYGLRLKNECLVAQRGGSGIGSDAEAHKANIMRLFKLALCHHHKIIVETEHVSLPTFGMHMDAARAREALLCEPYERKRRSFR